MDTEFIPSTEPTQESDLQGVSAPLSAVPPSALLPAGPESIEDQLQHLIAEAKGVSIQEPSPEEMERYLRGYSFGALVWSFFYFRAVKDNLFVWLSVIFSFTIFPALFVLPVFARRRAWAMGGWLNFNDFQNTQKKWDKTAVYGGILLIILSYVFLRQSASVFQSLLKQNSTSTNTVQQLKDLQQGVQGLGSDN
jgi:hypothetical protein